MMGAPGDHITYHSDGSVWNTFNGIKTKGEQFQPFSSFKGSHNLVGLEFTTDLSKKSGVPQYEMKRKRLDSTVYINVRPFIKKSADVGIYVTLLEPGKYSLLEKIETFAREIHLYPYLSPWLVLTVYFSGHRERKK